MENAFSLPARRINDVTLFDTSFLLVLSPTSASEAAHLPFIILRKDEQI
jgi:hypothetical protein